MPDNVYEAVVKRLVDTLQTRFTTVTVASCLPGKTAHKDVNLYLGGPLEGKKLSADELAKIINATGVMASEDENWTYCAVECPDHLKSYMPVLPEDIMKTREELCGGNDSVTDIADAIQVAIQQHMDPVAAEWTAYWTSYGNLGPVMDAILRQYGIFHQIKPEDKHHGLVLRPLFLEEVVRRKLYHVEGGKQANDTLLTSDPSDVLRFCGMLDGDQKWSDLHFDTPRELALYICRTNRFFNVNEGEKYREVYYDEIQRCQNPEKLDYFFFGYFVNEFLPSEKCKVRETFTRGEVETEARAFFPDADGVVKMKIRDAKAKFEPEIFWQALEIELIIRLLPETVLKLNMQRYGAFGMWWRGELLLLWNENLDLDTYCIAAEDRRNLRDIISQRISCIFRCIKRRTAGFDARYAEAPVPFEYEYWEKGDYQRLFRFCVDRRHDLENDQKAEDESKRADLGT